MSYIKLILLISSLSIMVPMNSKACFFEWVRWKGCGSAGAVSPAADVVFDEEDLQPDPLPCGHRSCEELEAVDGYDQDEFDAYMQYKRLKGCPWWQRVCEKLLLKIMGIKEK